MGFFSPGTGETSNPTNSWMAFPKNKNISVSLVSGMGFIQPRSMIKFQKVWAFYGNFGKAYLPKQRASSKTEAELIKTLPWPAIGKEFPQDQSTIVGSYHPTTFYILYQYLNLGYLGFFFNPGKNHSEDPQSVICWCGVMHKHHSVVLSTSVLSAIVSVSEQALLAVPTQYAPESRKDGCLLSSLSYQSWSLNSYPFFLTQVSCFLVLADTPAKFPAWWRETKLYWGSP